MMDGLSHAPIFLFFIFKVHESARRRVERSFDLESFLPFLKKPISPTLNCFVLVAGFVIPFLVTILGLVYSPTHGR